MPKAARSLKRKNSLPGICGRVCPQEVQCECRCVLAKKGAPVAIGRLERYVADWELCQEQRSKCARSPRPQERRSPWWARARRG